MGRALDAQGEKRKVYKLLMEKHEGKTLVRRSRFICEFD